jgi:LuxR family quorum-sensing system transcriptional regulator CciR
MLDSVSEIKQIYSTDMRVPGQTDAWPDGAAAADPPTETAGIEIVAAFVRRAGRDGEPLDALLGEAARALGFRFFALAHHGDLSAQRRDRLLSTNYPESWRQRFIDDGLHRIDPVQRACRWMQVGFRWSRLDDLLHLTPGQRQILETSRRHGIGDGFTVPIHLPGERSASCSFAVAEDRAVPTDCLFSAQLLGQFAFEAARPLAARADPASSRPLSPRQRQAVRWMAAGHSDRSIASRLGLSEDTVTKYLNAARKRYGLARRTQLVAAALFDGEIGFDEILGR